MTNTTHLRLHTWAPSDPVSVAEMNENFTAIDEASGRTQQTESLHESAIIRTAHRSAKNALKAYREDENAYDDTGIWLADFSKGASQAQEVSNLRLVSGCYVLPHTPQNSVTLMVADEHLDSGETRELAGFTAEGFGTVETITVSVRGTEHSNIRYYLYVDGEKRAETSSIDVDDGGGTFAFTTPLEVYPNMNISLRAHASNGAYSSAHIYAGQSIELTIAPCQQESGWLRGKAFDGNGASQALIWLYWTGAEPTLDVLQNAQEETLPPVNQGMTRFFDDELVHCAYYRTALGAVGAPSLRFYPKAGTRLLGCTVVCI